MSEDLEIGGGVTIRLDEDGGGLVWHHPVCKSRSAWSTLRYMPDPNSTGHVLVEPWPNLTIEGSLLCPAGCGKHGWIRSGKWVEE
jgi:hypothetical protein